MRLWFWIAFFIASFTALTFGQGITVVNSGQRLTPAEAAAILRGPAMQSNRTDAQAPPPRVPSVVVPSTPGASTWLQFPKPAEQRRLDGTPITMPPANYGGTQMLIVAPEAAR